MNVPLIPDRELNLHGDQCPITFAKTKIALEEMVIGQVLCVLLDWEPATRNVPKSVELYGDEILALEPLDSGGWALWIRKRIL